MPSSNMESPLRVIVIDLVSVSHAGKRNVPTSSRLYFVSRYILFDGVIKWGVGKLTKIAVFVILFGLWVRPTWDFFGRYTVLRNIQLATLHINKLIDAIVAVQLVKVL